LPDPSRPDSLAEVQQAADNLNRSASRNVDETTILVEWEIPEAGTDEQAAALLKVAGSVVPPSKSCFIHGRMVIGPSLLAAVTEWGAHSVEDIIIPSMSDSALQPLFWSTLRQLQALKSLNIQRLPDGAGLSRTDVAYEMLCTANV
jgi:hypothetical protein